MITKKQLKSDISKLTKEVEKLTNIVVTDELKKLREIKKLYEKQNELLSKVRFKVKSVKLVDNGENPNVVVIYQLPVINIPLNEEGEPAEKNDFFYSVNALGLVGNDDYEKIRRALRDAKEAINFKTNTK